MFQWDNNNLSVKNNYIADGKTLKLTDQNNRSLVSLIITSAATSVVTTLLLFIWFLPGLFNSDSIGWGVNRGVSSTSTQTEALVVNRDFKTPGNAVDQIATPVATKAEPTSAAVPQLDDALAERQDTVELTIPPKHNLDYRLAMDRDFELNYHWTANNKTVYTELRGEAKDGSAPSKTFAKLSSTTGKGFFIIPFNGQFGWHWQNKSNQPITIRLYTKGTYQVVGQVGASSPT